MTKKKGTAKTEEKAETKKKGIVISETEDDMLLGGTLKGDPDDFKEEIKKEAEKGRFFRTIAPILVFLLLGAVVAYGTMYYKNQSDAQPTKKTEEKIQTPPTVDGEEEGPKTEEPAPTSTPAPTATPAASYTEYTVVAGDTLSGIANAHDLTSTQLAQYNGISVDSVLQIGQKLKIPK